MRENEQEDCDSETEATSESADGAEVKVHRSTKESDLIGRMKTQEVTGQKESEKVRKNRCGRVGEALQRRSEEIRVRERERERSD
jgi:hypothetical protein